jgi:glycosyltransferase involved in cell wall biosynthesis
VKPEKIKIAFIKFGGLAAGGTERWLQVIAANLDKNFFHIDYYYCDAAPYLGSSWKHPDTDENRLQYMLDNKVNLIKFHVGAVNARKRTKDWIDTDFWDVFDEKKYDFIQTAKSGLREYPFFLMGKSKIVDSIHLDAGVDFSPNIIWTVHNSCWQRRKWIKKGGNAQRSSVCCVPIVPQREQSNLRQQLKIPDNAIVAGFHQRNDDNIFSPIPLASFKKLKSPERYFIILGGGEKYRTQAKALNIDNVIFLEHNSDSSIIGKFLNTLDIYAHGRYDGETFGAVIAEAMLNKLPCISHKSHIANAHHETMGPGGIWASSQEDYTNKLELLFLDKNMRDKIAAKAYKYAMSNYTLDSCIKKMENLYRDLLDNQKPYKWEIDYKFQESSLGFLTSEENIHLTDAPASAFNDILLQDTIKNNQRLLIISNTTLKYTLIAAHANYPDVEMYFLLHSPNNLKNDLELNNYEDCCHFFSDELNFIEHFKPKENNNKTKQIAITDKNINKDTCLEIVNQQIPVIIQGNMENHKNLFHQLQNNGYKLYSFCLYLKEFNVKTANHEDLLIAYPIKIQYAQRLSASISIYKTVFHKKLKNKTIDYIKKIKSRLERFWILRRLRELI